MQGVFLYNEIVDFVIQSIIKKIMEQLHDEESLEQIRSVVVEALQRAFSVHENLGETGEELIQKNQFGETALKVDIKCENAIIDFLREMKIPIRIISEEHGTVDVLDNPQYLGILDGLDGSSVYKKERGIGRYGTMFGIFNSINPSYEDYVVSGIMQHATKRLYIAVKNGGAFIIEGDKKTQIHSSKKTVLDTDTRIYVDEYFEINKKTFSENLKEFEVKCLGSSAIYYADVASGDADLALECTRKNNLEIAIAYGLETEAGAVMVDLNGVSIADKKYLEFGQKEKLPIITAATKELSEKLIEHIKKDK